MNRQNDIAIIGLAVMGRSLAMNMADHGFKVAVYNRSEQVTKDVMSNYPQSGLNPYYNLKELVASLKQPRKIMMMIKAGAPVDDSIDKLIPFLDKGDIIMDGGNSFYEDSERRSAQLAAIGINYFGVGISGGEEGARRGPSIMPGGDSNAYQEIQPILEAIAAVSDGEACCTYIGPKGAGHYVKMVHNGIEYADMQLIAESYLMLKYLGGFTNKEMAALFKEWNQGELESYLMGISADIFNETDELSGEDLLDKILDSAAQKGTGRWAAIEAMKQGIDISLITAAGNARVMSNDLIRREKAANLIPQPKALVIEDKDAFAEVIRQALYMGKIIAYAQGFALMQNASDTKNWNLDLGKIASIFRAGCIIQAKFLNDITRAYQQNKHLENLIFDEYFLNKVIAYQDSLRKSVTYGIMSGLPLPVSANAITYLDSFKAKACGANLIQAQRDYFGAHTYERNDREGVYHHDWSKQQ